jgi:uncharacterized protein YoxC
MANKRKMFSNNKTSNRIKLLIIILIIFISIFLMVTKKNSSISKEEIKQEVQAPIEEVKEKIEEKPKLEVIELKEDLSNEFDLKKTEKTLDNINKEVKDTTKALEERNIEKDELIERAENSIYEFKSDKEIWEELEDISKQKLKEKKGN